jgi:ubiquinone/menaquinone biosynthesis C-methylase UbiE
MYMKNDPYARLAARYDRSVGSAAALLRTRGMMIFPPREGLKVLDVGCGTGEQLASYAKPGCELIGIDLSPSMLEVASRKLASSARLLLEDATHMSFPDASFDLVTCVLALHEMPAEDRPHVVAECRRVTKSGGHILLIDFHYGPYQFPRGWFYKLFILWAEIGAGREHFSNYRDFIANRGLDSLVESARVSVETRFVFETGIAAIYLLSP